MLRQCSPIYSVVTRWQRISRAEFRSRDRSSVEKTSLDAEASSLPDLPLRSIAIPRLAPGLPRYSIQCFIKFDYSHHRHLTVGPLAISRHVAQRGARVSAKIYIRPVCATYIIIRIREDEGNWPFSYAFPRTMGGWQRESTLAVPRTVNYALLTSQR